jgi:hypothetical protein
MRGTNEVRMENYKGVCDEKVEVKLHAFLTCILDDGESV